MQDAVVCNASPLIFLAKIGKLELLDFYSLHIPTHVEIEILAGLKSNKEDAKQIMEYLRRRKATPVKIHILKDLPDSLGAGEKAVISLAVQQRIYHVLIDESKARTVARFKGLKPKGTLGVLWGAYKKGKIGKDETESLSFRLLESGYRIKEEIFIEFLRRLKESGNHDGLQQR
ncbi:MAG: hypothetical protein HY266_07605 [Deltaproteobacteria bacterium]|nr:hypothetical protein [Deltaproteobacteria bacterium]